VTRTDGDKRCPFALHKLFNPLREVEISPGDEYVVGLRMLLAPFLVYQTVKFILIAFVPCFKELLELLALLGEVVDRQIEVVNLSLRRQVGEEVKLLRDGLETLHWAIALLEFGGQNRFNAVAGVDSSLLQWRNIQRYRC